MRLLPIAPDNPRYTGMRMAARAEVEGMTKAVAKVTNVSIQNIELMLRILGIIVACALLVALHGFNIAINTLGAFVHCARLQYVEFYGKFYEPGGRAFKPLSYQTKHIRVTDGQAANTQ